jgi:hypothetical protein
MSYSNIEKEVISNSILLEKNIKGLLKEHTGKFVVFHCGESEFANDFEKALDLGAKKFGTNTGFIVRKLTEAIPVFACLKSI